MIISSCTMDVANYKIWKTLFDHFASGRKAIGSMGGIIYKRNNGRSVKVIMKWSDRKKALEFHESTNLAKAINQAGVISTPIVVFYDEEDLVEI